MYTYNQPAYREVLSHMCIEENNSIVVLSNDRISQINDYQAWKTLRLTKQTLVNGIQTVSNVGKHSMEK